MLNSQRIRKIATTSLLLSILASSPQLVSPNEASAAILGPILGGVSLKAMSALFGITVGVTALGVGLGSAAGHLFCGQPGPNHDDCVTNVRTSGIMIGGVLAILVLDEKGNPQFKLKPLSAEEMKLAGFTPSEIKAYSDPNTRKKLQVLIDTAMKKTASNPQVTFEDGTKLFESYRGTISDAALDAWLKLRLYNSRQSKSQQDAPSGPMVYQGPAINKQLPSDLGQSNVQGNKPVDSTLH